MCVSAIGEGELSRGGISISGLEGCVDGDYVSLMIMAIWCKVAIALLSVLPTYLLGRCDQHLVWAWVRIVLYDAIVPPLYLSLTCTAQ